MKQHSHLFNLNLCCLLVAATRPDASDQPLFNIISISHSVQLFDHLLTFEHTLAAATSCDHEQQACMLATNAFIKHQLNATRSRKSCTKIAEFVLILAVLLQTQVKTGEDQLEKWNWWGETGLFSPVVSSFYLPSGHGCEFPRHCSDDEIADGEHLSVHNVRVPLVRVVDLKGKAIRRQKTNHKIKRTMGKTKWLKNLWRPLCTFWGMEPPNQVNHFAWGKIVWLVSWRLEV